MIDPSNKCAAATTSRMAAPLTLLLSLMMLTMCQASTRSATVAASATLSVIRNDQEATMLQPTLRLRGGAPSSKGKSKTKSKTKSRSKKKSANKKKKVDSKSNGKSPKDEINQKLKQKDAAEALGDAILDRADVLRREDPFLSGIDLSVNSIGAALGASDRRALEDMGGGVEAATSSVIANYFLKSHGGAHGLQSACGLLAMLSGFGVFVFRQNDKLCPTLLRRTLIFAMVKHVSGLLAAAASTAKAVPKIGLAQTREWMEKLVLDPVSQYVFYTALLLLWMPSPNMIIEAWWWKRSWLPPLLIGPVLVREIVSNLLVLSDVMVLSTVGNEASIITPILSVSQSIINAAMSLVVSADTWRSAKPSERQAILAKLVSRASLVMEVLVGMLLSLDYVKGLVEFTFSTTANRQSFMDTLKRCLCIRLYIHFLWVRRSKISNLAFKMRGGATQLPFYLLDVVLEPGKSMGLTKPNMADADVNANAAFGDLHWTEWVQTVLGLED
mmetsp:Transcript_4180/g.10890  ORF Transcript_4180/g.10890 Transcript_4180/m.10890 type:complete len:500 (+) Transcript_4180:127-1626(+)|eukprot:CAMPEP_0198108798 /NCGR_PEP_ID=MMETSP1442-20131203/831_1 /TAXON_ID= /ORGANISM="Craspedostauros australis, Strain CCMP3328" /LENGTH=499 /DNA_ID=CAMNT_0043764179 /DNA_START=137 /DNA_END=1636 /DNA_ORIENTATION=+